MPGCVLVYFPLRAVNEGSVTALWDGSRFTYYRPTVSDRPNRILFPLCRLRGEMNHLALLENTKLINHPKVPSNVVLKKLRPSRWLSILMLAWGVVMVR